MKYRAVLFDLDGTLLDTLDDIWLSVNELLERFSYPKRERDEVKLFLGNGARYLLKCALPKDASEDVLDRCVGLYLPAYQKRANENTRPYDGVMDVLRALRGAGCKIAVVSNKPHAACGPLCDEMFEGMIDAVVGDREGMARKPAPDGVFWALGRLGADAADAVYVGDTEVDIMTGRNAGLPTVGVTWGFREERTLREEGADFIIHTPGELLEIVEGQA